MAGYFFSWCLLHQKSTIVVALTYIFIALFVVPYIGEDLAYSKFYSSTLKLDEQRNIKDNSARLQEAQNWLSEYSIRSPFTEDESTSLPEFCFVVISVSRQVRLGFLTQVVAGLVPQIARVHSVFSVYNAEGTGHKEAEWIAKYIPVMTNEQHSGTTNRYAKEKEDYVYALEWCNQKKTRFTVVIEDDALPEVDFMMRLQFLLKQRVSYYKHSWAFLKLFYPPKWQGWSNERQLIQELLMTSTLGTLILTIITYVIQKAIPFTDHSNRPSRLDVALRLVLSFCLSLYTLITLGRPHWLVFLSKISIHLNFIVPAPGCCTPAVLYPQEHLGALIKYLRSVDCSQIFPIDIALDKFAESRGLHKLLTVPDLFKHIGFVSSLGKGWKDPRDFRF